MVKRICATLTATFFLFAALPMLAEAGQPFVQQKLVVKSIEDLKQKIATADDEKSGALNAISVQFLDDLLAAGLADDRAAISLLVMKYVADVKEMQAAAVDTTSCDISFWISATVAASGMVTELVSGNSALCIVINESNKVADIMSASTKRAICVLDPESATITDDYNNLVAQLRGIATYNFATSVLDVVLCTPAPGVNDFISLLFDLIAIFSPPAMPTAS
jgi:hypothetical protein